MSRVNWKDVENIQQQAQKSRSKGELLDHLGLGRVGSNYQTLTKYLQKYEIDISHFEEGWLRAVKFNKDKRVPNEDMFTENSKITRKTVRSRIVSEQLIHMECASCGLTDSWNGKPIVLHLEHKNGIHNDHRLDNLEFLCPNCHSQTSTYAGRNIRSK